MVDQPTPSGVPSNMTTQVRELIGELSTLVLERFSRATPEVRDGLMEVTVAAAEQFRETIKNCADPLIETDGLSAEFETFLEKKDGMKQRRKKAPETQRMNGFLLAVRTAKSQVCTEEDSRIDGLKLAQWMTSKEALEVEGLGTTMILLIVDFLSESGIPIKCKNPSIRKKGDLKIAITGT